MNQHVIIFARAPRFGAVKTRLARDIGKLDAWRFYRNNLNHLLRTLSDGKRWQVWLAITPGPVARARPPWAGIPASVRIMPQGHGDLGQRMEQAINAMPPGPAMIIGSDVPDVKPEYIARSFQLLRYHDVAFGQATDGGYWLVGFKRRPMPRRPFELIDWSSGAELWQTIFNLKYYSVAVGKELEDIDTGKDLAQWRAAKAFRLGLG